jgi:hypothetical protein
MEKTLGCLNSENPNNVVSQLRTAQLAYMNAAYIPPYSTSESER